MKTQVFFIGAVVFAVALSAGGGAASPQNTGQPAKPAVQNPSQNQGGRSQSGPDRVRRGAWWKDAEVMKEVGITAEQSKKIDDLFHKRLPEAIVRETELKKQDGILQKLLTDRTVGADVIGVQVDRVEALRTTQYKTRTVMAYEMYLVLSAEQYKKLVAYWDRQGGRDSRSR